MRRRLRFSVRSHQVALVLSCSWQIYSCTSQRRRTQKRSQRAGHPPFPQNSLHATRKTHTCTHLCPTHTMVQAGPPMHTHTPYTVCLHTSDLLCFVLGRAKTTNKPRNENKHTQTQAHTHLSTDCDSSQIVALTGNQFVGYVCKKEAVD